MLTVSAESVRKDMSLWASNAYRRKLESHAAIFITLKESAWSVKMVITFSSSDAFSPSKYNSI